MKNPNQYTGILVNPNNIKIYRQYFAQMTELLGIKVIYRKPLPNKPYNGYGELDAYYYPPVEVGCIFDEHPTVKTQRKLGWNAELNDGLSIIHVPYDLDGLQQGALFVIPSPIENTPGRVFKVVSMQLSSVYPCSIACSVGPVYNDVFEKAQFNHREDNFNLLAEEEDDE